MALREEFTRTSDRSTLTTKLWAPDLHFRVQDKTYFKRHGLIGKDKAESEFAGEEDFQNYPVALRDDFKGKSGDEVKLGMFFPLTGDGKYGSATLVDSEQNMTFYNTILYLNLLRNGVGWLGEMSEQRSQYSLPELSRMALMNWLAQKLDDSLFSTIYNAYPPSQTETTSGAGLSLTAVEHPNKLFGGDAANELEVGAGDVLNTDVLERLRTWAENNNLPKVITKEHDPCWIFLAHPFQGNTLRADTKWREDNRGAGLRGLANPIFKSALGESCGIVVHESNKVASPGSSTTGGQDYAQKKRGILLGANSVVRAIAKNSMKIIPRNENDYGNKNGFAIRVIYGDRRTDYDSDPTGTLINQSSALVTTWAPNPNTV